MIHTPRYLRPDEIKILNKIGEDENGKACCLETTLKYIRVDKNYGITQKQRGIDTNDTILITIDMNDLCAIQDEEYATYLNKNLFKGDKGTFTLRSDDSIIVDGASYHIHDIKEISFLRSTPEFIEVTL